MSFTSASQPVPGKQKRSHSDRRGSTEASKTCILDGVRRLALRPVSPAENGGLRRLTLPKAARSPLLCAFCCFPPASRLWRQGGGSKNGPEVLFLSA